MSYNKHNKKLEKMNYDFEDMSGKQVVHVVRGMDLKRAEKLDRWTTNMDVENCALRGDKARREFHEHKTKIYNPPTEAVPEPDTPIVFSESLRHDMLRADILRVMKSELNDIAHSSKRVKYFFSSTIRKQVLYALILGTLDHKGVTIGYLSELFKTARSTVRKVIKDALAAEWIIKKDLDKDTTVYYATDITVNTYYMRLRRQYVAASPHSLLRMITYESLVSFEDSWHEQYKNEND